MKGKSNENVNKMCYGAGIGMFNTERSRRGIK